MSLFPSLSGFTRHRQERAQEESHAALIHEFKSKLAELEHVGHQLREAGHYIDFEYSSEDVARHNTKKQTSTLHFGRHLNANRVIHISKNPISPFR